MISLLFNPSKTDRLATIGSLIAAFTIASLFYRFGSFALECIAFLATWALLDLPAHWLMRLIKGADRNPSSAK